MRAISVLYITYDGITDHIGQSQVAPYLIKLAEKGFRITLLSAEKKNRQGLMQRYTQLFRQSDIEWHYVSYHQKPRIMSSFWDVYRMQQLAGCLIRRNNVTITHCRGYVPALIGLHFKKKMDIKFIFDMRDFWVDSCRETKRLDTAKNMLHKIVYKFFKKKEKEFLEHADQIVSLTDVGKCIMQEWAQDGIMKITAPITVIPCCADFAFYDPARLNTERVAEVRAKLGLMPDDFVLNYLGSLGPPYLIDEMIDFYKVLLERRPSSKFLIVANNNHQIAREAAMRKGVNADRLIITQGSKEEVPYLIAQSNMSVFFITPSFAKQASSPTKLAEYLAMNIPVISNTRVGDIDRILNMEKNNSLVVTRFNKEEYERVIDCVLQCIDAGRLASRENSLAFSLTAGVEAYSQVYQQLKSD